jgi:zinc transporter ZupT
MIFLVIQELLPESFAHSTPTEAAWGVTVGLVGMLGFIAAIGL